MRREKSKKLWGIIGLVFALCIMTAGYAAFQTNLTINGTMNITSRWDLSITGVTVDSTGGSGENAKNPTYQKLTANIEANLYEKGDYVIYNISVRNNGNLDAVLNSIDYDTTNALNNAVVITVISPSLDTVLPASNTQVVKVKIEYDQNYSGTVDYDNASAVKITLNYIQNLPENNQNE